MSIVSVCKEDSIKVEAAVQGKGSVEQVFAKRLGITVVDLGRSRGEVVVKVGKGIATTVSPEDPGNYVVILYDAPDGTVKAMSFYDPKFVIAG